MPDTVPDRPAIHFVERFTGPRPAVTGTGLDVWEIVETVQHNGGSASEAAAYLEVDPEVAETAMRYYRVHPGEIDAWIEKVHRIADRERAAWEARRKNTS